MKRRGTQPHLRYEAFPLHETAKERLDADNLSEVGRVAAARQCPANQRLIGVCRREG